MPTYPSFRAETYQENRREKHCGTGAGKVKHFAARFSQNVLKRLYDYPSFDFLAVDLGPGSFLKSAEKHDMVTAYGVGLSANRGVRKQAIRAPFPARMRQTAGIGECHGKCDTIGFRETALSARGKPQGEPVSSSIREIK